MKTWKLKQCFTCPWKVGGDPYKILVYHATQKNILTDPELLCEDAPPRDHTYVTDHMFGDAKGT